MHIPAATKHPLKICVIFLFFFVFYTDYMDYMEFLGCDAAILYNLYNPCFKIIMSVLYNSLIL